MNERNVTSRRKVLKAAGAAAGLAVATGAAGAEAKRSRRQGRITFKNDEFYGADGAFDVEKAKDGIEALCRYHGYPIFPGLREKLWVSDYGIGQFMKAGLAAYMFVNSEEDRYMLMDIFLMPRQMLPEHWHVAGEKNPPKREGWLVRWGLSHIVGAGEPNLSKEVVVPNCHFGGKTMTKHEIVATPGMFVPLAKVLTRHWQYGGPEGAIITEVANVHTNEAVRHTDPVMNRHFLGG
jgi:hypothetical protein